MKKYHWNNANLQRKSQKCDWAMMGFTVVALLLFFLGVSLWLLLVLFASTAVCWVEYRRIRRMDAKSKDGEK